MSCVASAPERFEENLGQPLVFLDGMAQGFDVGFLSERLGRFAHLTTKRMKYAAVMTMPAQNVAMRSCLSSSGEGGRLDLRIIRGLDIFGGELRGIFCKAIERSTFGRNRSCRGALLECKRTCTQNIYLEQPVFPISWRVRRPFESALCLDSATVSVCCLPLTAFVEAVFFLDLRLV